MTISVHRQTNKQTNKPARTIHINPFFLFCFSFIFHALNFLWKKEQKKTFSLIHLKFLEHDDDDDDGTLNPRRKNKDCLSGSLCVCV